MKNLASRVLIVSMALAGAVAVNAQTMSLTADVPFGFYMGSAAMPQGAYRVDRLNVAGEVITLRSAHASKAVTAIDIFGKSKEEQPRLVFHRYGDAYFLSEIWNGNGNMGRAIPRSQREKEFASNGAAPALAVVRLAVH